MRHALAVVLVSLAGEVVDMRLDIAQEPVPGGVPLGVLPGGDQTFVTRERNLGVDDHRPLLGKHDDDVRFLYPAGIIAQAEPASLRDVLPALREAGRLENA